jgi:pyruvate dehydrogenase E1 component
MHQIRAAAGGKPAVRLLGSGTILREVQAAAELLASEFGVEAEVWSATSFTELRRDAMEVERWNRLHPGEEPRVSYVESCLAGTDAPVVASTDYMRTFADQIRPWVRAPYTVLGTDGYGRSDWRRVLRNFFEVDRHHVVLAALESLGDAAGARKAIERFEIETEEVPPWRR